MRILGIETSCDETGAAIVKDGTKILSNVVASSQSLHIKSGGIIPEVAAREQSKYLIPVINETIRVCYHDLNHDNIDALAVTVGPGLIGSLLVGVETAKTLAYLWGKPIIPINHLTAHLYANWLGTRRTTNKNTNNHELPQFPAVGLIASGGHTDLVLMRNHGKIKWLGGTRDDAAGEAFDKIARLLGLPYPGGPAIAKEAEKFATCLAGPLRRIETSRRVRKLDNLTIRLPRPMIDEDNFDFSFSGLKTAVLREVNNLKATPLRRAAGTALRQSVATRRREASSDARQGFSGQVKQFNNEAISYLAFEVQEAITDVLAAKTIHAAHKYKVKSILLGGGVSANARLREKMESGIRNQELGISLFIPEKSLCTDNATVIASCAYFNYTPLPWPKIEADPGLYF